MFFISRTYHVTPYKIYSEQQHYRPSHISKNHVIRSTFFFKAPFWGGAPVGGPVGDPHCYGRHGGLSGHPLAPGAGWGGMPGARGSAREFFASWRILLCQLADWLERRELGAGRVGQCVGTKFASWRIVGLSENQKKFFGDTSADFLYGKKIFTFAVN